MAPPGLTALGAKGSVRDRLTPPGRVEGSALGSYEVPLRWRGGRPQGRHFLCRLWRRNRTTGLRPRKTGQPRFARGNAFPLWWLAPPPCPVGSMSLDSRVAYSSPMNPVPLPPLQFGGAAKGKRLNGQARRLTSPHCGGSMQDLHSGTITRAYCRAIYEESVSRCFILPPEQGEVRRSRIGGGERSEPVSRMLIKPYDTVR